MRYELEDVERPFVEELIALGWEHVQGDLDDPSVTGRLGFSEVIQTNLLRDRIQAINLRDGNPWLDEARLDSAVGAITRIPAAKLFEANEAATKLLLGGIVVDGLVDWEGGRGQTIQYIDWEHPKNNRFTAVNQYRVDCPPGYDSGKKFIIPDIVLFVNGIPIAVVECKSPAIAEPLSEAVDQLRRYSNQRKANFEVEYNEGNEALFATAQLLVATCFDSAIVGTIGAKFEHYASWKTLVDAEGIDREEEIKATLGTSTLSSQEILVAGMFSPVNLIDLIRRFTLFMQVEGRTIKLLARYQQYRAVNRAINRLKTGKTRKEQGERDERGGIIWHTQGSGKSLSMVFLIRKMRDDPGLRRFKVLVVTDRRDLQRQLAGTMALSGDELIVPPNFEGLKRRVRAKGPGVIFAMIQKYRSEDESDEATDYDAEAVRSAPEEAAERVAKDGSPYWGSAGDVDVLNEDESILILVDEAHRSHAKDQHAYLMASVPNAAKIGFTGTPIIMGKKKRTHAIFGEYIDRYTLKASEEDGATVPILYEGRTTSGAVKDGTSLDELFEDLFYDPQETDPERIRKAKARLEAIKAKYATKGSVFEATALIKDKAKDMLRHYVTNVMPSGLKAQVVAYSRRAAIRYQDALIEAQKELLVQAADLSPSECAMDDETLCGKPALVKAQVMAARQWELLASLEFVPVISSGNNDDPAWKIWTDAKGQERDIERFKKALIHRDPEKADALAFLIVKSMLLTGFDAPVEGVMYLDRPIREAELLQAIARVNRTGHGKRFGLVVDYYGVARHLKEALAAYDAADVEGALASVKDQLPVLRDRHWRVLAIFKDRGLDSIDNTESCLAVLEAKKVFAEFAVKLKDFLELLDFILPRPEALPFTKDAKLLAYIYARARSRFHQGVEIGKDVGPKVRKLIDDHVISCGVDPKIPPISLTDADFEKKIGREASDRAKASEMKHALEAHIREHLAEDPVQYSKLSERLGEIMRRLGENWAEIVKQLWPLISSLSEDAAAPDASDIAMSPLCASFHRTIAAAVVGPEPSDGLGEKAAALSIAIYERVLAEARSNPNLWKPTRIPDQNALRTDLFEILNDSMIVEEDKLDSLLDALMSQAKANHEKLATL
jgi:type I restriction enzyme, R subunit